MSGRLLLFAGTIFLISILASPLPAQTSVSQNAGLLPRDTFKLSLPQISVKTDNETDEFSGVSIVFPESGEQAIIGMTDDYKIKTKSHGLEKILYRELPGREDQFSKFEAKTIVRVDKRFCEALDTLDALLREKNWNRCRYLDAYFPRFLSGWYYLICSARNSLYALPRSARVPDKEFDVSLCSPKTDARVAVWSDSGENAALREAGRALRVQLEAFQKSLDAMKDREDPGVPKDLADAFIAFGQAYFNRKPPSGSPVRSSINLPHP